MNDRALTAITVVTVVLTVQLAVVTVQNIVLRRDLARLNDTLDGFKRTLERFGVRIG